MGLAICLSARQPWCMTRPLKLDFEGALYHVTSRGDRSEPIFDDDDDRWKWLAVLADGLDCFQATVYAYRLMGAKRDQTIRIGLAVTAA